MITHKGKTEKFINQILLITIFFQSVGLIKGIDTQPNFILTFLLFLPLLLVRIKLPLPLLIAFVICIISLLLGLLYHAESIDVKFSLTYVASICSLFAIFILYYNGYISINTKFLLSVLFVYLSVGVIQLFIPDFMSFLVTRSVDAALSFSESGRGVRSLTGEPAHLGKIITIISALYVLEVFRINNMSINSRQVSQLILVSMFFLLCNALVARSFYSTFNHFLLFFILCLTLKPLFTVTTLSLTFGVTLVWIYSLYIGGSDVRIIKIFGLFIEKPQVLLDFGAFRRVLNVPLTFNNLTHFGLFGAGNSDYTIFVSYSTPLGNLDYMLFNRLYGGVTEFLLKFGVFSLPIMLVFSILQFSTLYLRVKVGSYSKWLGFYLFTASFIILFQDGAPAKPLPLFFCVYCAFLISSNLKGKKLSIINKQKVS